MEELFFDASSIEPAGSFDPLPAGDYEVVIVESKWKPTKAGTGSYLEIKCQVTKGDYAKRNLWSRLNLKNPNVTAVEIAKRELSAICHAVGVLKPKSKDELNGIPLVAKVVVRENQEGEPTNEIKGWKSAEGGSAAPAATPTPKQPVNAGGAPW